MSAGTVRKWTGAAENKKGAEDPDSDRGQIPPSFHYAAVFLIIAIFKEYALVQVRRKHAAARKERKRRAAALAVFGISAGAALCTHLKLFADGVRDR